MKVPTPRRVSSGKWYINLRIGGESISVTEPTKAACVHTAQLIKAEYLAGQRIRQDHDCTTVRQALDAYIEARSHVLSPSTIRGYDVIRRHRWKEISGMQIADVKDWQAVVNREAELVGAKTLKNAWMLLASAIEARTGDRPDVTLPQVARSEHPYLTPEQLTVFMEAVRGTPAELPSLLGLCSLRSSEIFALQWRDVNLKRKTVTVRGALVLDMHGEWIRKETTKTGSSTRTVPILMPRLLELLKDAPPHLPLSPVVTCARQGLYWRINTICRNAGLPEVGIHGLRHSFASLAYRLNVPYKVAMRIGGWSDEATMQRIYTHIAEKDVSDAVENLSAFFGMQTKTQTKNGKLA